MKRGSKSSVSPEASGRLTGTAPEASDPLTVIWFRGYHPADGTERLWCANSRFSFGTLVVPRGIGNA
jgi:hypothetical protein